MGMLAARRLLVSVASTMISSQAVCSRISVSLPPAASATMPPLIMDSKIARPHASLDGASKDALIAQNQRKMILPLVQASPLALQHHALNRQEAALLMIRLLSLILRMLVRSKMLAARRLLVSVASTMISSQV